MNNIFKKGVTTWGVMIGLLAVPLGSFASITLPTTPLVSGVSVPPNVMLLLDNSGSMSNIVVDEPYDESTYTYTCSSGINSSSQIDIRISSGTVYFRRNGGNYQFGNTNCFKDDEIYDARLYANNSDNSEPGGGYLSAAYSGRYLNWYFDSATGAFDEGKKIGTKSRMEVTRSAASGFVDKLNEMRVGLATYNGSSGANILTHIDTDVIGETTHVDTLKSKINALSPSGSTPLVESLQDLGWYFTAKGNGKSREQLTLHEGETNKVGPLDAKDIFDYRKNHTSDTISPSNAVIQNWCQDNFIVAMTDGIPTSDTGISEYLQNYSSAANGVDVVQAMYETDLRPNLNNNGAYKKNNIITYLIGFADEELGSDQLMKDMATVGGGGDLQTAANSSGLVDAFDKATQSIFAKTAAMSSVSINSTSMSAGVSVFEGSFNTSDWSGSFGAYTYDSTTDSISSTASWNAEDELDTFHTNWSSASPSSTRNIFTYNGTEGVVFSAANYANLSANQQNDLKAGPDLVGISGEDEAKKLIDYIHGDKSNEGTADTNYRARSNLLGDIVNSTSVYVGVPELNWPDNSDNNFFGGSGTGDNYSDFKSGAAASRTPMTYVGANDGMLHGFDVSTGVEKLAYIPGIIASSSDEKGIHYLADTDYAHEFYVDLTPVVSDVYINSAWRSVLIGGLRAGGKGIFALDITNPNNFSSTGTDADTNAQQLALWEFSNTDDPDFGYSYSEPTVVMMANGKWAVIVGNGYNSNNSKAALFILFMDGPTGTGDTWIENTDYIKIAIDTPTNNGLSTPTVIDIDGDSVADRVYAGDLQGNLWAFDISNSAQSNWGVAHQLSSSPTPLFTATDSAGKVQPITSAPKVLSYNSKRFVLFGTGKYLEASDLTDSSVMSYYSILDDGSTIEASTSGDPDRDALVSRTLLTSGGLRTITGGDFDLSSSKGWYMDLLNQADKNVTATAQGERVISESTVSGDVLFFNTIIPDSTVCSYGGTSWYMSLDLITGLAPDYGVFDADGNGDIDTDDAGYVGEKYSSGLLAGSVIVGVDNSATGVQISRGSDNSTDERDVHTEDSSLAGRLSWAELLNN